MNITGDQILALLEQRKQAPEETWRQDAILVQKLMVGDLWAPVFEDDIANKNAMVANHALQNLEQMVKRIVSTQPNVRFMAVKQGNKKSDGLARQRRLASLAFWDQNKIKLQDRKRVRWLQGYGVGPTQVGPHPTLPIPKYTIRNPLLTYSSPCDETTDYTPHDCIFSYQKTYAWISEYYPRGAFEVHTRWSNANQKPCPPDQKFDIVEYIDAEERVLILGFNNPNSSSYLGADPIQGKTAIELDRMENPLGVCPVVSPTTIGIDRIKSSYVDNVGMYIMRNKLAALQYYYAEKTVFPRTFLVEPANSVNGDIIKEADGRLGITGHIRGGSLETVQMPPDFKGTQILDRLTEEERIANSTPADFAGQSGSNIRTGVRGNNIISAAVDFTIQEVQDILCLAKEQELRLAIKVDKTYFNRPKSFNVGWEGLRNTTIDYKPGDIWENDNCKVFYSSSGADVNQLVISGGQRVAQQTMSRESFMMIDPLVEDPETERDLIQAEALRQAGFTQLMQPGAVDPVTMAKIADKVASNEMEWWEAVVEVQKEEQERQAPQDEEGNDTAIDPNSPEAQDGIVPGSGIEGAPGMEDLAGVLGALRRPQMAVNGV